jgi:hypothetical protein
MTTHTFKKIGSFQHSLGLNAQIAIQEILDRFAQDS